MRYRRGKIIAVALLCVSLLLCLSGVSLLLGLNAFTSRANDSFDPSYVPTFDDLYARVPFAATDTGEVVIGQNNGLTTSFVLRDESYYTGSIYDLLNGSDKRGFSTMTGFRKRNPYPLFTNTEMQTIIGGGTVDAPVIMLDPLSQDNVVLFELVNLTNPPDPDSFVMKHDGKDLQTVVYPPNTAADYICGKVGTVALNELGATTIRGMFSDEGYYEFQFEIMVVGADELPKPVTFSFAFYIVHKDNYENFPRFPVSNRMAGASEIYNYSYGGGYPTVSYNPDYFRVEVTSVAEFDKDDDKSTFRFYNIGEYKMTSTLIYYCGYTDEFLEVTRYRPYDSTLYILGFQAYFGGWHEDENFRGPLPFFDANDSTNSSDISYWVDANSNNLPTVTNDADVAQTLQYSEALVRLIDAQSGTTGGLTPVRTNFPPVKFVGNVDYAVGPDASGEEAILATLAFHGVEDFAGATKLWHHSTLDVGKPFSTAGEYLVTVYFRVNSVLCRQTFYFEITNSVDIKFATSDGETLQTLTLDELVRNKLYQSQEVTVMYDGNSTLGQFEVPPTLKLERADLGTSNYRDVGLNMNGSFKFNLVEGHYRLSVIYGAYAQAVSVAEIVVDLQGAGVITATSNAASLSKAPTNTAVFGAGKVSLAWGEKLSGVGYKRVTVEFYKIDTDSSALNPNEDRTLNLFSTETTKLFAAATMVSSITSTTYYTPTKTEDGWFLNDKFSEQGSGLYKIIIEDDIGNLTNFILIIDDTKPTFVQSVESVNKFVNVSDFPGKIGDKNKVPVQIGFGNSKLIGTTSNTVFNAPEFQSLIDNGILALEKRNGANVFSVVIPLAQVEISVDCGMYEPISTSDLRRGYVELAAENTFYFRTTDILGNISEYYIMLTHDNSQGMVLAESSAQDLDSRGFLDADPTSNTSLVTVKGGMTNRQYVTFSFDQKAPGYDYRVKQIDMDFYPLTFDKTSPNYPFAAQPVNYLTIQGGASTIYFDNESLGNERDQADTYRIALYNKGEATRRGLYVIARKYANGATGDDPQTRQYWFIVDDTGMLYYNQDEYQTDLQITFGSKTALAENFDEKKNLISSNMPADIQGFPSKYNQTTVFYVSNTYLDFPSLIPRFSVINNGLTTLLGEGTIQKRLGDVATGDVNYRLVVADNARNISIALGNGSATEIMADSNAPTSANYGELTLILDTGYGTKATIIKNGATVTTLDMQYSNGTYTYIIDPSGLNDLRFRFENDPKGFFADIDVDATSSSWVATGLPNPVDISYQIVPPAAGSSSTYYVYDIQNPYLTYNWTDLDDGDGIAVTVVTVDGDKTVYQILFDKEDPTYNLTRIKKQDNLARDLDTLPLDYIYGLTNDFKFERDAGNPYLDTREISYREISANGEGESSAVTFRLDSGRTFASIVGLRYNEVKYYQITEQDYAGHVITYTVQLQGDAYDGDITFVGAVSPAGDNLVLGIEMQVRNTSVDQFWASNRSFKFVCGDEYYFVLGGDATWYLNGVAGSGPKNKDFLIEVLNGWINAAAAKGEKCSYTLYDRIGEVELFEFYNIRENDAQIELEAYTEGGSSVYLQTTNYTALSRLLTDPAIADRFKIRVQDATDPNKITDIVNVNFSMPMTLLHNFNIQADKELIITVTDPFGRQTLTEYHGQKKGGLNFIAYGNTVDRDGITYIGDSRGVELQFMRSVYYINVYDGNGNQLSNISSVIIGDITTYYFRPTSQYDTSIYRIEAVGRLSGAVLFEKTFAFDTRMPSVSWTNASDQPVDLNATFVGTINMQVITNDTIKFGVTVSYVRTYNGRVERVTLRPNTESFQFDKVGQYIVTLRSEIWATSVYEFEIADINDNLVSVYDDGVLLTPSEVLFKFYNHDTDEYEYIKNYMFTNDGMVGEDYTVNGLEVVPSSSTNRVLVGQNGKNYYSIDNVQNALIWCLAVPTMDAAGETVYTSKIYFATTGITAQEISTTNAGVSLVVDNVVLNRLHDIYEIRNNLGSKGVTIRLSPGTYLDDNGVPYNQYAGNSLVVDCYRNGELIKTLAYDEALTIGEFDSGYYEFTVRDLVGNVLMFGNGEDAVDKYTLVNLSKPMVLINNSNPVNGMIYNDMVEFKVVNLADELFTAHYGQEFFDKYFYVSDMIVYRDGVELPEYTLNAVTTKYPQNTYVWTTKGDYRIELRYVIGDHVYIEGQYAFQIIPSVTSLESLSLNVYADINILSVKKNNYLAQGYANITAGDKLSFNANENPGRYEITLQSTDPINGQRVQVITFSIGYKSSLSSFFTLDAISGGSTTGVVSVNYRAKMLYLFGGEITIQLYKDGALSSTTVIDAEGTSNLDLNAVDTLSTSEAGLYSVRAYDAEGDLIYADSWTIVKAASPMGAIIVAIVAGLIGIGLIVFFRMRHKMAVK